MIVFCHVASFLQSLSFPISSSSYLYLRIILSCILSTVCEIFSCRNALELHHLVSIFKLEEDSFQVVEVVLPSLVVNDVVIEINSCQ